MKQEEQVLEKVSLSDPAVAAIPVRERDEPLVDLRTVAALRLDGRFADDEGRYAQLRIGVVDRLVTAQTLLPQGFRLLVVEGYRPLTLPRSFEPAASGFGSPHVAGAAVDVTLCTVDEVELDLGAVNAVTTESGYTAEARHNRDVLAEALSGAGLVNCPGAWWHWSYGDRYWAYLTGSPQAWYGPASP
ncbi:M15 family metallopeptidase [Lentzea sp. NPDC058450]|uniref:M15 family metallopeptidase n=1 Tax=Lentzea sp. NPDC058450 TaxID=3346505 RepID=UPI00364DAFF2